MTARPALPRPLHRPGRRAALAACLAALALAPACAGGRDGRHAPAALEHAEGAEHGHDAGAPATPAASGSQLSEAAARALLAERFRAAGFRVRYDVPVARDGAFTLTVDGYDPAHRVGFEYIDPAERDTDLDAAERAVLVREREQRILVVDAADAAGVEAAVARFLAATKPPG